MFGTPVYTVMGGQSKCPGETGTNNRQGGVTITEIVDHCGADRNSECAPPNLAYGDVAVLGVVIQNFSPTGATISTGILRT